MKSFSKLIALAGIAIVCALEACSSSQRKISELKNADNELHFNPLNKISWNEVQELSKDSDVYFRIKAVYVAGNTYHRAHNDKVESFAWPIVFSAFDDTDPEVRGAAYQCAEDFGDKIEIILPRLERGLNERSGRPESFAADTIAKFGADAKRAVPALAAQLAHGPRAQGGDLGQQAAAEALGHLEINSKEAVPVLEDCARKFTTDPEFYFLIVSNLYRIAPDNQIAFRALKEFENGKYGEFFADQAKWYLDPNQSKP